MQTGCPLPVPPQEAVLEQASVGGQVLGTFFQLIFQPAVAKGSGLAFPPFLPLPLPKAPMVSG